MPQFLHFHDSGEVLPFIVRQQHANGASFSQSAANFFMLVSRRSNLCALVFCFLVTILLYVQLYKFPSQLQIVDDSMSALHRQRFFNNLSSPTNMEEQRAKDNLIKGNEEELQQRRNHSISVPKFKGPTNERQRTVRDAFLHAWRGYKEYAFGHDHLRPVSRTYQEWMECGLTILDSLDTMLIMGLNEEFAEAKQWVEKDLDFDKNRFVNLFESTIRLLGGLLSAYHLSGDPIFLTKAEDIGKRLLPAISASPTAVPFSDVNLRTGSKRQPSWSVDSSLAEVASLQLEFRELSRLTGNLTYEQLSFRISEHIHEQPCNQRGGGLCPMYISPNDGLFKESGTLTFGARADSYYEYLLKQWLQTGKTIQWLADDYKMAMASVSERLWHSTISGQLYFVGELLGGTKFSPKMDHLVCFLAGTLAMGTQHGMPKEHLEIARNLSSTCHAMYENPTGLGPEIAWFNIAEHHQQRESDGKLPPDLYIKPLDAHSLLRPEAFEAWFYMHRITGGQIYKDWGWAAFEAINRHARIEAGGFSSVQNVKRVPVQYRDMMESFFLGESLKYLYLLLADDQQLEPELPLDKWVFNTEAHPLPIHSS